MSIERLLEALGKYPNKSTEQKVINALKTISNHVYSREGRVSSREIESRIKIFRKLHIQDAIDASGYDILLDRLLKVFIFLSERLPEHGKSNTYNQEEWDIHNAHGFWWYALNGITFELYFPEYIKDFFDGKTILGILGDFQDIDGIPEENRLPWIIDEYKKNNDARAPLRSLLVMLSATDPVRALNTLTSGSHSMSMEDARAWIDDEIKRRS